jgi:catechol 2,3-dioxygenase-like lactoylglutathione lyase family enzyme
VLDHIFLTVTDVDRSIEFYTAAPNSLGITVRVDYDGRDGPPGHPDLYGFGADGRIFFWLRQGEADAAATHVGFVANGEAEVNAAYKAAIEVGATDGRSIRGVSAGRPIDRGSWRGSAGRSGELARVGR